MEEIVLKAAERSEKPKKVRNAGFIPGVLNGPGTISTPVKFEDAALNKIIARHGTKAKLWVELGGEKKFGFIREVQKHPVESKILHIAIQLVAQDQEVKMRLPVVLHGQAELEHRLLQAQVCKSEIEVSGRADLIPEEAAVDVSKKEAGENATAADFNLPEGIKVLDPEHEIYVVIKAAREEVEEEPEESEEVKPAAEA